MAVYESMACRGGDYDIHLATNGVIALTGADSANAKRSLNVRTSPPGPRQKVRIAVEDEGVYRRTDGCWLIVDTASREISQIMEQIGVDAGVTGSLIAPPAGRAAPTQTRNMT